MNTAKPNTSKVVPIIVPALTKVGNDQHFETGHLLIGLKHRTVSSGLVTMGSQGVKFGLNLTSTVVLARLLAPHDFGLLAMVTSLMSLLRVFKDAGLSSATIQQERITHAQVSNFFWINLGIGGLLTLVLAASAPLIAGFYKEPQLVVITLWLSLCFMLGSANVQHLALLRRQMRFKAIAIIEVGYMAVGGITGIIMALLGYGYWSLVGMNLALEVAEIVLTWSISSWRPQLPKRRGGTRRLLSFGANMTVGSAFDTLSKSVDNVLIGRVYGPDAVGIYSRAMVLLLRPLDQLLAPIGGVFIPTFSRLQSEPNRYRRAVLQLNEVIALLSFFFSGLLLPLSLPVTLLLLGPKWEHVAVIFKGLTIASLYLPISNAAAWLLISQGRDKDYVRMNSIRAVITIVSVLVGLSFGPVGVAFSLSIFGLLVSLPVLYYLVGRRGPVSTTDLWTVFFRHLPLWGVVYGATFLVHTQVANSAPLWQLLACVPAGLLAGIVFIFAYAPSRGVAFHLFHVLREFKNNRKT
jgi:O-antigen/teichoic acid export membrane protein